MTEQTSLLPDIAAAVRATECVLFLGAGVHAPAPSGSSYTYPDIDRPPIGSELSLQLAKSSGFVDRRPGYDLKDLQKVSLDYELQKGRNQLVNEIRKAIQSGRKPSPLIRALAALPFRVIITTNYDTLFEDALRDVGKSPVVSCYHNNVTMDERTKDYPYRSDPSSQEPFVLKIHGDIVDSPASIVITEEDYIQFVLRMSDKHRGPSGR